MKATALATEPRMQLVQRDILLKALAFYEQLAREYPSDPKVRFKLAQAYHFVARLQARLGEAGLAEQAFRQQIALLEELLEEFPNDRDYRFDLYFSLKELSF